MQTPAHIRVINKVPGYTTGLKNLSKKKIQESMRAHGYDEDFVEAVDDRFCQGFGAARDIIIEVLAAQYWSQRNTGEEQDETSSTNSLV